MPDSRFGTSLDITILTRASGEDWYELDRGPGVCFIPEGQPGMVRARSLDDAGLRILVEEIKTCPAITALNLSENRNITDKGMVFLATLSQITWLHIGSTDITNEGTPILAAMTQLEYLSLSFCPRLGDRGMRPLKALTRLTYLDLQGCVKVTHSAIVSLERRGLTIHK